MSAQLNIQSKAAASRNSSTLQTKITITFRGRSRLRWQHTRKAWWPKSLALTPCLLLLLRLLSLTSHGIKEKRKYFPSQLKHLFIRNRCRFHRILLLFYAKITLSTDAASQQPTINNQPNHYPSFACFIYLSICHPSCLFSLFATTACSHIAHGSCAIERDETQSQKDYVRMRRNNFSALQQ